MLTFVNCLHAAAVLLSMIYFEENTTALKFIFDFGNAHLINNSVFFG